MWKFQIVKYDVIVGLLRDRNAGKVSNIKNHSKVSVGKRETFTDSIYLMTRYKVDFAKAKFLRYLNFTNVEWRVKKTTNSKIKT